VNINDEGPAFPIKSPMSNDFQGMTLRDYFAAKAMQGLLAGLDKDARRFLELQTEPEQTMAKASWLMADAMLKARGKQ
jgi:hypothetical protein